MRTLYRYLSIPVILLFLSITLLSAQKQIQPEVLTYLTQQNDGKGYVESDFQQSIVRDYYTSRGITHIYLNQTVDGIGILDSYAAVHLQGDIPFYHTNQMIPGLKNTTVVRQQTLATQEAIEILAASKNYRNAVNIELKQEFNGREQKSIWSGGNISSSDIVAKLTFVQTEKNFLKLSWDISLEERDSGKYMNYFIDAVSGQILKEISWTVTCASPHNCSEEKHEHNLNRTELPGRRSEAIANSYNVFPWPIESPNFGDRSNITEPWLDNTIASPNGWHTIGEDSFTTTHGNNVDSYDDSDNTNNPANGDVDRADGGLILDFDFPWDSLSPPANFKNAAITNLFYWANVTHDVWYNYGFDEESGNFQEENFSGQGNASDYVSCEAQDGSGTCNANFSTPADGSNPRMQMYLCNGRDGDFDNGVVVHEYGHGISIRLTGGPANSGCLNNSEQMGEGWSDYFGMVMTIEAGDLPADARGMGTWLFGEGPTGPGIRPYPYSTDFAVNPMTYSTIGSGVSVPHGVGSVWCTMLWDLTWAFIGVYGWDPDIYDGTGGNNMAMELVIAGLKLQPCSPGFTDGRDAIIAADQLLNAGANACMIWEVFANRGLGFSADQGSSGSVSDGNEAFDLPPFCTIGFEKISNVTEAAPEDEITYTLSAVNNTDDTLTNVTIHDTIPVNTNFVQAENGGILNGNVVSWPGIAMLPNDIRTVSFRVEVDSIVDPNVDDFMDNMENGSSLWNIISNGSTDWVEQSNESNSDSTAWFANDGSTPGIANLIIASAAGLTNNSFMSFAHMFDTEGTWDGGQVEISIDGGKNWVDLGPDMVSNGYNSIIYNSVPGFSGNSNGWINTVVDLSAYADQAALIRFEMNCDQAVGGVGWYIDDVVIANQALFVPNEAHVTDGVITSRDALDLPTKIVDPSASPITSNVVKSDIICAGDSDGSAAVTPTGGSGSYSYLWSSGDTTAVVTGLTAGVYFVTISDGATSLTELIQILEPAPIVLTTSTFDAAAGANGSASATAAGGMPPYSYGWSNGDTTATIENLAAGTYTLIVTDETNCMSFDTIVIIDVLPDCEDSPMRLTIQLDQWPEETSFDIKDIDQMVIASGGPYNNVPDGTLITEYLCIPPGCYTFTIYDVYGDGICASYSNPQGLYTLTDLSANEIKATGCGYGLSESTDFCQGDLFIDLIGNDVTCPGGSNGSVQVIADGGSGNYTYLWEDNSTNSTRSNLTEGLYSVTVNDGLTNQTGAVSISLKPKTPVLNALDAGEGSLRQVIADACDGDTITFDIALMDQVITLTSGEITLNANITVMGFGADHLEINGSSSSRLFNVLPGQIVRIESMTLANGSAPVDGGALLNSGVLTLENVDFSGNYQGVNPLSLTNKGSLIIDGVVQLQQ